MNTHRLLNEFMAQDCDAAVRQRLLAEITKHGEARAGVVREFNFNRFNIYLDFRGGKVRIEDELDVSEMGSHTISIAEFTAVLNSHRSQR